MAVFVLAVSARAAGFADLSTDTKPFLVRTAVSAPAPGAPVESPWLKKARDYYRHLSESGMIAADVETVGVDRPDDRSPGYAQMHFERGVCTMMINERLTLGSDFKEEFWFKFMIYHELSHCHLFANPRPIRPFPRLSSAAARMVSDLVHLDFIQNGDDEDERRPNAYGTYQETYADVHAIGMLLAEGEPASRIEQILGFRTRGMTLPGDTHMTAGAIEDAERVPWASLDAAGIDAAAREIADKYLAQVFLKHYVRPEEYVAKPSEVLASKVSAPYYELRHPEVLRPESRDGFRKQLGQAAAAPTPVWRDWSRLAQQIGDQDQFVDAFFRLRYGKGPRELSAEDAEIRDAVWPR